MRLGVTTPWYPGVNHAFSGVFVRSTVEAVRAHGDVVDASVVHGEAWPTPRNRVAHSAVERGLDGLIAHSRRQGRDRWVEVSEGRVLRLPVPMRPGTGYADQAAAHERWARAALAGGRIDGVDLVHGHVGITGGWVATRLAEPGVPVVLTEHASVLDRVLAEPRARDLYEQVLERSAAVVCVSEVLRSRLSAVFGERPTIRVVANPVPVERIATRDLASVNPLRRWLYVGRLIGLKGVRRLLESFAVCAQDDDSLALTLIGSGPLAGEIERRADALGLGGRVHLRGEMPADDLHTELARHDLLVHLSETETFGLTVVEAAAAGLAVLVTRSGGPEESLAGLEDRAGALVAITGHHDARGVEEVVEAYRALRRRADRLEPAAVRDAMVRRYGSAAVGARLTAVYRDVTATAGPR